MISLGVSIDARDKDGKNAFVHALFREDCFKMAHFFLSKRANLDERFNKGRTPLIIAVLEEKDDVIKFLLEKGADVDVQDDDKKTALVHCIEKNLFPTAEFLVTKYFASSHFNNYEAVKCSSILTKNWTFEEYDTREQFFNILLKTQPINHHLVLHDALDTFKKNMHCKGYFWYEDDDCHCPIHREKDYVDHDDVDYDRQLRGGCGHLVHYGQRCDVCY